MKSRTKSIRPAQLAEDAHFQLSLPVADILRDVHSAFFGLCVDAGKAVLGAMMEAERTALCGPKGSPDPSTFGLSQQAHAQPGRAGQPSHRQCTPACPRPGRQRAEPAELHLGRARRSAEPRHDRRHGRRHVHTSDETTLDQLHPDEMERSVSKSAVSPLFVALGSPKLAEWLSRPDRRHRFAGRDDRRHPLPGSCGAGGRWVSIPQAKSMCSAFARAAPRRRRWYTRCSAN